MVWVPPVKIFATGVPNLSIASHEMFTISESFLPKLKLAVYQEDAVPSSIIYGKQA